MIMDQSQISKPKSPPSADTMQRAAGYVDRISRCKNNWVNGAVTPDAPARQDYPGKPDAPAARVASETGQRSG
jgi:hypothetical protein